METVVLNPEISRQLPRSSFFDREDDPIDNLSIEALDNLLAAIRADLDETTREGGAA